jgi:L-alanine-DL-glutamate epimerase-like enolase superfamily enzyme
MKIRRIRADWLHVPIPEAVEIPDRPGLGVTIDEAFVARYRKGEACAQ